MQTNFESWKIFWSVFCLWYSAWTLLDNYFINNKLPPVKKYMLVGLFLIASIIVNNK